MSIHWERTLPVLVSIGIIIAIAILRQYSRHLAAIVAVMPINIPLGMWIVYSGAEDKQQALTEFSSALFLNILPLFGFMLVAWYMSRNGYDFIPTILVGYIVWAVGLGGVLLVRSVAG
jgi:positive regulator of sigma E activity